MTPTQAKLGRYAVGLGVRELAELAKLAPATVTRYETGVTGGHADTANAIQTVLEARGVTFLRPGDVCTGIGLSIAADPVTEKRAAARLQPK